MIIIGLSGKKRSGKDTVASMVTGLYPASITTQLAFADPLYQEVARACFVSVDYVKQHKENFRLILQGWGTDFRRKLQRDDYWTNKMLERLNQLSAAVKLVVITDVRFQNEYDLLRKCGGYMVRIKRPSEFSIDGHSSETELDGATFNHTILNDSTKDNLLLRVHEMLLSSNLITPNVYSNKL